MARGERNTKLIKETRASPMRKQQQQQCLGKKVVENNTNV
jgi:hypothetical protein